MRSNEGKKLIKIKIKIKITIKIKIKMRTGAEDNLRKESKQKRGDGCYYHFLAGGRGRHIGVPRGRH